MKKLFFSLALATAIMSATAITPPQDDKKTSKETVAAKEADTKTCKIGRAHV